MSSDAIKAVIPGIDQLEKATAEAPLPFVDLIPLMIPEPTYRALSDASALRGMTVAQLVQRALTRVLEEE